jgi:hypothetical protein
MAGPTSHATLDYSTRERVAHAAFARPERLNSLSEEALDDLGEVVRNVQADTGVRALVISGSSEAFSVGLDDDLLEKAHGDPEYFENVLTRLAAACLSIESLDVPVVGQGTGRLERVVFGALTRVDGAVDRCEDPLRRCYAKEGENGVIARRRVELDGADVQQSLEQGLVGLDVLHPVQRRVLLLAREDPVTDVEAAVADRVNDRRTAHKADEQRDQEDSEEHRDRDAPACRELADHAAEHRETDPA